MELIPLPKDNKKTKPEEEKLSGEDSFKMDLFFWLQALVAALITLILVFTFVGRIIGVDGDSMYPTLHDRDMLVVRGLGYTPENGDIVVLTKYFENIQGPIVKRVIAVGGQTVQIDYEAGTVTVDGQVLEEDYIKEDMIRQSWQQIDTITVPEGFVFVMGDNRNISNDSRNPALGAVDVRYILGEVAFTIPALNF